MDPEEPAFQEIDYSKIERRIRKEPRYEGKPSYALFIFDTAAEFRVWVVLDENALYFDRNGNGDLTGPDKKIAVKRTSTTLDMAKLLASVGRSGDLAQIPEAARVVTLRNCTYDVGKLRVPGSRAAHTELQFKTSDNLGGVFFSMKWGGKEIILAGSHIAGPPKFAPSPATAPVLRPTLAGPLTFALAREGVLTIGEDSDIALRVGHAGSGVDTFCAVNENYLVPGTDKILVTLIARDTADNEVRVRSEIKGHC